MRECKLSRKTNETDIELKINLDGSGNSDINTGIAFFDHMLNSFAKHGCFDLSIKASGDLTVDDHHTVEDVGITLGNAIVKALGDKKGIERFADARVPMDEALASAVVDISGRSFLVFYAKFTNPNIGGLASQNVRHFFESLTANSGINAHLDATGENDHHKAEALFKALGIALKRAVKVTGSGIPSTKGML
jgi:imidazoleglycerol-phosphate dehydratase